MKYISKKLFLLPLASLLIAVIAFPHLPEQIATHFDFQGTADGYNSRWFVFVIPLISLVTTLLADIFPRLDPKTESYRKFPKAYQLIHVLINALLLLCNLILILFALGYQINVGGFMSICVGLMFIIMGNYMPKFKQAYFCGIRTPWALADEENWRKTHRMGGKLWVIGGILFLFLSFVPETFILLLTLLILTLLCLIPYLYSYLIYRKQQKEK